jgi:hypothetical protein
MPEEETKKEEKPEEYLFVDGHFTNLEGLARKIQGELSASGQKIETDEDAISHAFAGFDIGTHLTDAFDTERLGQFLEEFGDAWKKVAKGGK